jgi:hypothetical protein
MANPILPVNEPHYQESNPHWLRKPHSAKILSFVLEVIVHLRGGLPPSSSDPETIQNFLLGLRPIKNGDKPRSQLKKAPFNKHIPIGLTPIDREGWFNALMQFILYIPGFAEAFHFVPRSLFPVREFIDCYHRDQQENRSVSSANGTHVFEYLRRKLPNFHFYEAFLYFLSLVHRDWRVYALLQEAIQVTSADIFVKESSPKKQFFTEMGLCYELDAFIELRVDESQVNYVAYIKTEGQWYQCDDVRITQMRSDNLRVPLSRAILSHFRRIFQP